MECEWICGKEWMSGDEKDFPVMTVAELTMTAVERSKARKERILIDVDTGDSVFLQYYCKKASAEIYEFLDKLRYEKLAFA